ncbi:MAG: NUDIX domain-containing protein [Oscillospiraceae bacterium]|jgi:ADP-ribose pyrophosphatase YjhB (NUDIX family)|nr:NUDIX domain-containing protein [Oscillospiraceae bacterium]
MRDLTFKTPDGSFNYRVGAIILHGGKLLMVKNPETYYWSVGGRVALHETAEQAVVREVFEETGIAFEVERLAFVHENFFDDDGGRFHELSFFFLMEPNAAVGTIQNRSAVRDAPNNYLVWLPLDSLGEFELYPKFFKTKLQNLSGGIEHIVTHE